MRHISGRARSIVGAVVALILCLWVPTQFFGAPAVQSFVLNQMQAPSNSQQVAGIDALRADRPTHFCNAVAVAPLLVRLDFGHLCGPLCGRGRTDYFLWLPWGHYRVYVGPEWVS
jgi:hypothetical protein